MDGPLASRRKVGRVQPIEIQASTSPRPSTDGCAGFTKMPGVAANEEAQETPVPPKEAPPLVSPKSRKSQKSVRSSKPEDEKDEQRGQTAVGRCSIEESCKGAIDGLGEAKLCLPTVRGTFLASLLSSSFIFVGLIALSASETGIPGFAKKVWSTLLLRYLGWVFVFYIPIHFISVPILRNLVLWSLQPGQDLRQVLRYAEDNDPCVARRAALFPYLVHACWLSAYAFIICVNVGEEEHFGILPVYGLGNILMLPVGAVMSLLLAPPTVSKSYAFKIGPSTIFFPIIGFLAVVASYIVLRRLIGPWLGFVMPFLLSAYELLGTALVSRVFAWEYVTNKEVREGYFGTNQGLVVSMAICNLHAMAEGARLTMLYVDNLENSTDWDILVPVLSGLFWNVTVRLGGLDRFLYVITRGWRKPNNSKLLRDSGYCMGYPRFGAIGALLLTRLCIGTPLSLDGPDIRLLVIVLLAEISEDFLSYALWHVGVNVFPRPNLVTEQEVQEMAEVRISKRKGSKESAPAGTGRMGSKESASAESAFAVVPSRPSKSDAEKGQSEPSKMASDRTLMKSTCWKVRVAYDFRFRIEAFGKMPFWGHLLPTAMAQFHTIFAMIIFSGGLDFVSGLCERVDFSSYSSAVLWWPVLDPDEICRS